MAIVYPRKKFYPPETAGRPEPEKVLSASREMSCPLDIERFIKKYNIEVCKEDMDYDISGYVERRGTKWVIGVNKYHSERRQRFTLAHEFAHYILHKYKFREKHSDKALFRTREFNTVEQEANEFASELLIPQEKFRQYVKDGITKIADLSDKFDVSVSAIRYKAYKLGYLDYV